MKMTGGPASVNIKILLIIVAIFIGGGTLYYTQNLVTRLQHREREMVQLYAKSLEYVANGNTNGEDLSFIFENLIKPIDFPVILTDAYNSVNLSTRSELKNNVKNIKYDSTLAVDKLQELFARHIKDMDAVNKPIVVAYADTIVLTRIHYGDSDLITQLKFYPVLQIILATLFIIVGYISFSTIKKSEQGNIWVGMAKETAHQLGTPISSLMGWLEILLLNYKEPDKVLDIVDEISNDVEKLNKITYRFSKIGSKPELKKCVVYDEILNIVEYFKRRLPQTGKDVALTIEGDKTLKAMINSRLFEWVLENLIKNALDAIDKEKGGISFYIREHKDNVEIEVSDTGKGIDLKRRKDIFRPGYSTKRRGWGLGLSLSKRIIEDYHKGKIFVKNSIPDEGTVFKIILKKD
jgi:nitrogen-specific signal transduction histidine kinase